MKAIDVAGMFIQRHGDSIHLTNLSLNKLVYFAQVESIRRTGEPLFDDEVQAWNYGPVEPDVYRAFKVYGSGEITASVDVESDSFEEDVVDAVAREYGWMTAFDLVNYSHRDGRAWKSVYDGSRDKTITVEDIKGSKDVLEYPQPEGTLAKSVDSVRKDFKNTLRLLGDA